MSTENAHLQKEDIVIESWLHKKGEHIRNWRPRYFILFRDGTLLGFRSKPKEDQPLPEPLNNFMIRDAATVCLDKPRPNMFIVRCLQWTTVIERTFYADSADFRQMWIEAIQAVSSHNRLKENAGNTSMQEEDTNGNPSGESDVNMDATSTRSDNDFESTVMNIDEPEEVPRKNTVTMDDFDFLKVLGQGTFGKVILCREKSSDKLYAIKIIRKEMVVDRSEVAHTLTENRVLYACVHPFLTLLKYSFQAQYHICFVMEFANGGELFTHLQRCKTFSEARTRFYGSEIILALGYLHHRNIVYRDMKLENLLLDRDGHIKITDFGLCKEEIKYGDKTSTFCGTPEYLAPEVIEDIDYDRSVDWWGVGVVMYEMMCGRLPFSAKENGKLFELITTCDLKFPNRLSPEAVTLLSGLLERVPAKRLGAGPDDAREVSRAEFFKDVDWEATLRKEVEPPFKPNVMSETDTSFFDRVRYVSILLKVSEAI
ncbi:Serine/threonine-protein kinase akt-2 [Caenorhabditis elegans]|uniref:Isoform b of Serine/threonine-protein kinase akt-2 n=1 Tax=Caenorhabditis elegans TaxID=6239 RepID=Q9XTG7-2|nr:Serine/threonine-protein kinase akt-2 [Caenorhabditis elegans]AAC62468.1 Akt/PKB serine/threonine kinase [Caenorhabditis elegans]CAC70087.1 Serine/threonine-protein kinase akt-2 [Caenorhabditis elegans]|eukprot:NP_001024612.1 Serine/threonine-protein kinase akt-2 [Caenorhabditis elegans]